MGKSSTTWQPVVQRRKSVKGKPVVEVPCPECPRIIQTFKKTHGSWEKRLRGQMLQHLKIKHGYHGRPKSIKADEAMKFMRWPSP